MASKVTQRINLDLPARTDYSGRITTAELTIETSKAYNKGVESDATVNWVGDGFRTHAFSLGGPSGDFHVVLLRNSSLTATQKAINTQFAQVFTPETIADVTAKALAHYANQKNED